MIDEGTELDVRVEDRLKDHNGRPVVVLVLGGCSLGHGKIAALAAKYIDQVAIDYPSPEPVTVVASRGDELEDLAAMVDSIAGDYEYKVRSSDALVDAERRQTMEHYAVIDAMAAAFIPECRTESLEPIERPWIDREARRRNYGRREAHRLPRQLGGRNKSHGRGRWR